MNSIYTIYIYNNFKNFLKEQNCFKKFICNLEHRFGYRIDLYTFISNIKKTHGISEYKNLVGLAFGWGLTLEGRDYWFNISCNWMSHYSKNIENVELSIKGCKSIW